MICSALKLLTVAVLIQASPSSRIITGYDISIEDAPYTVFVDRPKGFCGGTILTEKFVATAAHCIEAEGEYFVRAGSTDPLEGGQLIKAKKVRKHPELKYLIIGGYNDFGLIVLEDSLVFNSKVQSVSLAKDSPPVGTMMLATGWGWLDIENSHMSSVLRAVQLPIVADDVCRTLFDGEQHDSILCAGTYDQGMTLYLGDSGGPLVFNNTLYGISSFVDERKTSGYPVGFARVSYGYDWFKTNMEENM